MASKLETDLENCIGKILKWIVFNDFSSDNHTPCEIYKRQINIFSHLERLLTENKVTKLK